MKVKTLKTLNDHINEARSSEELLRIIADILTINNDSAKDVFKADHLQEELAVEMIDYAHQHRSEITNFEVSVASARALPKQCDIDMTTATARTTRMLT